MKSKSVMVWLVAMLLAVMVALWAAERPRSLDAVRLGVMVDGGIEELATTIEAKEKGNSIRPRETLIEVAAARLVLRRLAERVSREDGQDSQSRASAWRRREGSTVRPSPKTL